MSDHKLQKGPLIGTENLYLALNFSISSTTSDQLNIARMQTALKRAWVESMCGESHEEQVARIPQVLDQWRADGYVDAENRWTKKRSASPTGPRLKQKRK